VAQAMAAAGAVRGGGKGLGFGGFGSGIGDGDGDENVDARGAVTKAGSAHARGSGGETPTTEASFELATDRVSLSDSFARSGGNDGNGRVRLSSD
jgi:hypothetical protein